MTSESLSLANILTVITYCYIRSDPAPSMAPFNTTAMTAALCVCGWVRWWVCVCVSLDGLRHHDVLWINEHPSLPRFIITPIVTSFISISSTSPPISHFSLPSQSSYPKQPPSPLFPLSTATCVINVPGNLNVINGKHKRAPAKGSH